MPSLREARKKQAAPASVRDPTPEAIAEYLRKFFECLEGDPENGRELPRQNLGEITLIPKKEDAGRSYRVAGVFRLYEVCSRDLCGGAIVDLLSTAAAPVSVRIPVNGAATASARAARAEAGRKVAALLRTA